MYSISQAVSDIISVRPYLRELLSDNLLNITELARSMRHDVAEICMKEVTTEAVAMAIRRLPKNPVDTRLAKLLKEPFDIMVRSRICEITVRKQGNIKKIQSILGDLTTSSEHFFTITQGIYEDTIMVSEIYRRKVLSIFKHGDVVAQFDDLVALTIRIPPASVETPGVYYMILKTFALEDINVIEIVSTYLECTILVREDDAERAFAAIKKVF